MSEEGTKGYFGPEHLVENKGATRRLAVDGVDRCVGPAPENVLAGTYPLARPLLIYMGVVSITASEGKYA